MATIKTRTTEVKDIFYKNYTAWDEYQKIDAVIPEGYEWTGEFRCIKPDEKFLGTDDQLYSVANFNGDAMFTNYPRFILREIPSTSTQAIVQTVVFKHVRTGTVKPGEYFKNCVGDIVKNINYSDIVGNYAIYKQVIP